MTTINANQVTLGIESFGDDAPLVLLAGGPTMLSWPDALCERLAAAERRVVRYDLRDSGESTTADPAAPTYTLRDLAADAAALVEALGGVPAHLAGIGVGGMVAQVAALDHPGAFSALTLAGTRAVAPGKPDADLPDHDEATMKRLFTLPIPDWSDREAVAEFAAARAEIRGDDPIAARAIAARIWDRTPGTAPPTQMANQLGMVFAKLNCKPRWRERLPEIEVTTLVVHGRRDPLFPVGNGEAIAREIRGARLLVLEEAAIAIPGAAAGEVAEAMLALGLRTSRAARAWHPRSSGRRRLESSAGADRRRSQADRGGIAVVTSMGGQSRSMSNAQPSGTVTLVFTDVEGSTKLLEVLGTDAYREALAEHRRVVREAFGTHGGYEVDNEGDSFFYAFASAQAAVSAVGEAMVALGAGSIRIRVGIHTGEPSLDPPKYVGIDVHRAARIMGAAHGGQVVLSPSTVALLEPDSFDLTDLGEHRLKDLSAPERVFQLGKGEFPPIRSLHRTNLPMPATSFIGRERELAAVARMLGEPEVRLVSLVGPGGTGKTRLALQAAAEASDAYPDGVFWAPLAPVRDPALVLPTIAAALSVREWKDGSPVDDLARALARRRLLVLVDNVEHLLPDAADLVGTFVDACPTVTTVVTTRERLQLPGEQVYAVPSMSETDGEALFLSRAAAVGVELDLSNELQTLCERLDNLPLALELAAARTVVFSPAQLLDRLSQRLDLLKAGRGVDPRQETLRSTIAWSHDLLDADEQTLFRRISVFAGGCSFESAEQVAGADPDRLQSLLDKSLLRRRAGRLAPRFWMLETIREFAAERLAAAGESDDLRRRHLAHYAALAEGCFDETLLGHGDLDRLEEEHENLRLALDVAVSNDPELALELGHRLVPLWLRRGAFREGRERLAAALSRAPDAPAEARAWALRDAAFLAGSQSDLALAYSLGSEALALFRELGNRRGAGSTLISLGWSAMNRGDLSEARRRFEEAADALSDPGEERLQRRALMSLAAADSYQDDHARALELLRDVVASTRREGSAFELALAVGNLGVAQANAGETDEARRSYEESIALSRLDARKPGLAVALCNLGYLLRTSAPSEALAHFSESLTLTLEMEEPRTMAYCLEGGAWIFAAQEHFTEAATLLGAAASIRAPTTMRVAPSRKRMADTVEAQCREALSAEVFARAWDEGAVLDAIAAADWALRLWEEAE